MPPSPSNFFTTIQQCLMFETFLVIIQKETKDYTISKNSRNASAFLTIPKVQNAASLPRYTCVFIVQL